jgi:RHS repeat-associated protein
VHHLLQTQIRNANIDGVNQIVFNQGARRYIASGLNVLADEWVFGNGLTHGIAIDRDGRFSRRVTGSNQPFVVSRDASGRINRRTDIADPAAGAVYDYDEADRLITAQTTSNGAQSFTHDLTGNRLSHTIDGMTENLTISASSNRISSISGFSRTYAYKATGEITSITGGAADLISESRFETPLRNLSLSYDPFNRLNQITGQNLTATYAIAATGMRVKKTVNGKTTRFHYSASGKLLYEKESTGKTTQHLYHRGEPIGVIRDNTLYFVVNDHLGRPEQVYSNTDASLKWKATNTAFGRKIVTTDQIGGYQLGFPGQYHDEETGFAYNVMRDYDQSTGRYLQPDPIGLMGGVNLYGYVAQNPLNGIDPLGLCDEEADPCPKVNPGTMGTMTEGMAAFTQPGWKTVSAHYSAKASIAEAQQHFPRAELWNGRGDGWRHFRWNFAMGQSIGNESATVFANSHEVSNPNPSAEHAMDMFNNAVGRAFASDSRYKNLSPNAAANMALLLNCLQTSK